MAIEKINLLRYSITVILLEHLSCDDCEAITHSHCLCTPDFGISAPLIAEGGAVGLYLVASAKVGFVRSSASAKASPCCRDAHHGAVLSEHDLRGSRILSSLRSQALRSYSLSQTHRPLLSVLRLEN